MQSGDSSIIWHILDTVASGQMSLDFFLLMFKIKDNAYAIKALLSDDHFRPPLILSQMCHAQRQMPAYMEIGVRPTLAFHGKRIECHVPASVLSKRTYAIFCNKNELLDLFREQTRGFLRYSRDGESVVFQLKGQRDRYYPAENLEAALGYPEYQWSTGLLAHNNVLFLIQRNVYAENISQITTGMIKDGL
jgi:hypothetical protein